MILLFQEAWPQLRPLVFHFVKAWLDLNVLLYEHVCRLKNVVADPVLCSLGLNGLCVLQCFLLIFVPDINLLGLKVESHKNRSWLLNSRFWKLQAGLRLSAFGRDAGTSFGFMLIKVVI